MWTERQILWIAIVYRVFNCFLVQTWFVPDEYWQSLEPAHKLAFGYGYLTWEWQYGLRSYIYPLVIAIIYKILELFSLDYRGLLIFVPRLCQSLFGALADFYFYKFVKRLFGDVVAIWTLASYWLNWFEFFCTPRTLANTVETQLLCIGLCYYPWPDSMLVSDRQKRHSSPIYLMIATLGTIMRPTSAIIWLPLCLWHFWRVENKIAFVFRTAAYAMYISNGLPTVCLTHSIPIVIGIVKSKCRWILFLCLWYIIVHSCLPHKELRFMLPVLPLLSIYIGLYLSSIPIPAEHFHASEIKKFFATSNLEEFFRCSSKRSKALILLLAVTNLPVLMYTGLLHQRGCLDIPKHVYDVGLANRPWNNATFWFLTPCFSTPLYSYIHLNMTIRFLTCEPNLNHTKDYVDEADAFYADPEKWLRHEFNNLGTDVAPTHLLVYESLWHKMRHFFELNGFRKCQIIYNTDFPQSERQSKFFFMLCKNRTPT